MIDACNDINGVILQTEEVDGKVDDEENIVGGLDDIKTIVGNIESDGEVVGVIYLPDYISATIDMDADLIGQIDDVPSIEAVIDIAECDEADPYCGDYEVTPKTSAQTMPTKDKLMLDDVKVKAIPYYETSNAFGTTVYIGE